MCLGIPGSVIGPVDGHGDQLMLVDVQGVQRQVNIGMLESPPAPGSWVIVHMGFAMDAIDEAEARDVLSGLEMMNGLYDAEETQQQAARGA